MKKHIFNNTLGLGLGKDIRNLSNTAHKFLVSLDNLDGDIDVGNKTEKVYYGIKTERNKLVHDILMIGRKRKSQPGDCRKCKKRPTAALMEISRAFSGRD
jgi:hypothetical protein